ncbi:MAG: sterol desaturase family protein, partial [Myxococcales bacterium FL481]
MHDGPPTLDGWVRVLHASREPLAKLVDAGERIYWPMLAVSLVLAVAWLVRTAQRRRGALATGPASVVAAGLRAAVDRRIWAHPSAWLDYKLLFAKALLRALLLPAWAVSTLGLTVAVVGWLDALDGTHRVTALSPAVIVGLYTVVLFVTWDLSRYLLHRAMHRVSWLWAFHQVHHSARVLTPFTLYRSHPVEAWLFGLRGAVVTALVTGGFFHVFGRQAVQLEILGVNALGFCFNLAGGNLRHSHVRLSFGPLERVFISPAQHQIHHGMHPLDQNTNYGTWLAIWDRIGGSLRLADSSRLRRFGLAQHEANHAPDGLLSALIGPFAAVTRQMASGLRAAATSRRAALTSVLVLLPTAALADQSLASVTPPSAPPTSPARTPSLASPTYRAHATPPP